MAEVKDFERHQRFRKYLDTEEAQAHLPDEFPLSAYTSSSQEATLPGPLHAAEATGGWGKPTTHVEIGSWPHSPRSRRVSKVSQLEDLDSHDVSDQSRSMESTSGSSQPQPLPAWTVQPMLPRPMLLPPPFSHGIRIGSDGAALPMSFRTTELLSSDPGITVERQATLSRALSPPNNHDAIPTGTLTTTPVSGSRRFLRSAMRFVEQYVHSPSTRSSSAVRLRPARMLSSEERAERPVDIEGVPNARFRIYNDSQPATSQPQTPQNLPEARHQSRLRGSYTAPVLGATPISSYREVSMRGRRSRRSSPPGLSTPGFRGLYGGIENTDDNLLFEAASRLFDLEDGEDSNDG